MGTQVLASKREEVSGAKRRYDDGLEKVISTEEQVVSAGTDGRPASKRDLDRKSVCLNCYCHDVPWHVDG